MRYWYSYKSKDGKVKGIVLSGSKEGVARLAGYDMEDLIIREVIWDGKQFREPVNDADMVANLGGSQARTNRFAE